MSAEFCLQIPDEHLSGFETYDRNNSDPIETLYVSGSGLNDTDTVIYVRSENTPKCQDGVSVCIVFCFRIFFKVVSEFY